MVEDKERRNFCEFFDFNPAPFRAGSGPGREADARAKLAGLFGGAPAAERTGDARARLEGLFKKKPDEKDS